MRIRYLPLMFLLVLSGCATTSDYEKGFAAARAGDHDQAIMLLKPYAETDSAVQYYFGHLNDSAPNNRPTHYDWAMGWYYKAAQQGHCGAANNIGVMYEYGKGVDIDVEKAIGWYTLAARLDCSIARTNLTRLGAQVPAADLSPNVPQQQASHQESDSWAELASLLLVLGAAANTPVGDPSTENSTIRCSSYTAGPNTRTTCK